MARSLLFLACVDDDRESRRKCCNLDSVSAMSRLICARPVEIARRDSSARASPSFTARSKSARFLDRAALRAFSILRTNRIFSANSLLRTAKSLPRYLRAIAFTPSSFSTAYRAVALVPDLSDMLFSESSVNLADRTLRSSTSSASNFSASARDACTNPNCTPTWCISATHSPFACALSVSFFSWRTASWRMASSLALRWDGNSKSHPTSKHPVNATTVILFIPDSFLV